MATAQAGAATVDKSQLVAILGWTRPRLDRRLEADQNFPVVKRGSRAGGWEFDSAAVISYLASGKRAPQAQSKKEKSAPRVTVVAPNDVPGVEHSGETTARQRRDAAQAALLEDKLRRERGELLEVEEVRLVIGTMLAHLGKGLDGLPDLIVKQLGVPEEDADQIRTMIDDLRRNIVADLRAVLGALE